MRRDYRQAASLTGAQILILIASNNHMTNTVMTQWRPSLSDRQKTSSSSLLFLAKPAHTLEASQVYSNFFMAADQVADCALCCLALSPFQVPNPACFYL